MRSFQSMARRVASEAAAAALLMLLLMAAIASSPCHAALSDRVTNGIQWMYTFDGGQVDPSVTVVADASGRSPSLLGSLTRNSLTTSWSATSAGQRRG